MDKYRYIVRTNSGKGHVLTAYASIGELCARVNRDSKDGDDFLLCDSSLIPIISIVSIDKE